MSAVGFIGLGPMGYPMAAALAEAGFEVAVWNRTATTAERFCAEFPGATPAASPAQVASRAPIVITMLPDLPQVQAVYGAPDGLRHGWAAAREQPPTGEPPILVVMGTVSPVAVAAWDEELRADGVSLVDAPVSGGPTGAQERRLSIMCGGEPDQIARCQPYFEAMGRTIKHLGPVGSGELAKACNQVVVAGTLTALGEALNLARAGGLDLADVLDILQGGLAASEVLSQKRERYETGDYSGGGSSRNQVKDLEFILAAGQQHGVNQPISTVALQAYRALVAAGDGHLDHSAVIRAL